MEENACLSYACPNVEHLHPLPGLMVVCLENADEFIWDPVDSSFNLFRKDSRWFITMRVWCAIMFLSVDICSLRDRPVRKPSSSCLNLLSTRSRSRYTLPGLENSVMPLQLLQLLRCPFFYSFTMSARFQSSGTFFYLPYTVGNVRVLSTTISSPFLISSSTGHLSKSSRLVVLLSAYGFRHLFY